MPPGHLQDRVGSLLYNDSPDQREDVAVSPVNCSSVGLWTPAPDVGYLDRENGDDNFSESSPGRWLGMAPPGSPTGIRAFRFDWDVLRDVWGNSLPFDGLFPVDVSNSSNEDSDGGGGVIDQHDDCIALHDPGQVDTD